MQRQLSDSKRSELRKEHRKTRDGKIRDRIKALLLLDKGYSYAETAQILLLDEGTIRRHEKDYFDSHKLAPENGGSVSHLSEAQRQELLSHLSDKVYLHVKDICAYVKSTYEIEYTTSGMTKWLKANGFRYKKPHGVPAKADAQKQAEFRKKYDELKASMGEKDVLYFADSVHPQHQTQLAYGWIAKGKRKAMKMTACQKRIHLIGGINLSGHKIEYRQVNKVNGDSIIEFLNQLIEANKEASTIHLIWDNAGYHRSEQVGEFVKGTKIKLHFLPPYSPNLNPIERLWKVMHEQVTYNRYYEKFADFTEGILHFFNNISEHKDIISKRINDNFQLLQFA